jgi:hypothetical protein
MGAATCLVLAGTIALTLVSGLIAFHGWPGVRVKDGGEQRALIAQVRAEADVGAARAPSRLRVPVAPRTVPAAPARRVSTAGKAPSAVKTDPVAAPATAQGAGVSTALPATPVSVQGASVVATKTPKPAATVVAQGEPVRKLGETLNVTVDTTGAAVAHLVAPAAPALGSTVQNTTDVVGDLLSRVTGVVGTVVDGLGQPPVSP